MNTIKKPLSGKIALVTGASRGIGRGAAIGLGEAGATVYVTARTLTTGPLPGTAEETAVAVTEAGGKGIAIQCDHADDSQVEQVERRISEEQGRLDILVNNVLPGPPVLDAPGPKMGGVPFWEAEVDKLWDACMTIGVRGHYVMTKLAMPLLLKSKGLVVNTASVGGCLYTINVIYGVGKVAQEKMMRDMAVELEDHPVSIMTVWPGFVRTEVVGNHLDNDPAFFRNALGNAWSCVPGKLEELEAMSLEELRGLMESPVFTGRAIAALANDPNVKAKSGGVFSVVSLAKAYGFTDVDGSTPDGLQLLETDCWRARGSAISMPS